MWCIWKDIKCVCSRPNKWNFCGDYSEESHLYPILAAAGGLWQHYQSGSIVQRAILPFADLDKIRCFSVVVFLMWSLTDLLSSLLTDNRYISWVHNRQATIWRRQWGATMKTDCTTEGERYLLINLPDRNKATTCHSTQTLILCFGVLDVSLMPTFHLFIQFCNSPYRPRGVREDSNIFPVFLTALFHFKITVLEWFTYPTYVWTHSNLTGRKEGASNRDNYSP